MIKTRSDARRAKTKSSVWSWACGGWCAQSLQLVPLLRGGKQKKGQRSQRSEVGREAGEHWEDDRGGANQRPAGRPVQLADNEVVLKLCATFRHLLLCSPLKCVKRPQVGLYSEGGALFASAEGREESPWGPKWDLKQQLITMAKRTTGLLQDVVKDKELRPTAILAPSLLDVVSVYAEGSHCYVWVVVCALQIDPLVSWGLQTRFPPTALLLAMAWKNDENY